MTDMQKRMSKSRSANALPASAGVMVFLAVLLLSSAILGGSPILQASAAVQEGEAGNPGGGQGAQGGGSSPPQGATNANVCGIAPSGATLNAPTDTNVVYDMDAVDSEVDACNFATGTGVLNSDYGCCGGGKLKSTSEHLCKATALCDGAGWHDSGDSSQAGEVFLLPEDSGLPFPVANVGVDKPLVMCVDTYQAKWFLQLRAGVFGEQSSGCIPSTYLNTPELQEACGMLPPDARPKCGVNSGNGTYPGDADYLCPVEYYMAGGNGVPGSGGLCRMTGIVDNKDGALIYGDGILSCVHGAYEGGPPPEQMWGHAYFMYKEPSFTRVFPFNEEMYDSSRCPSAVFSPWQGAGPWDSNVPTEVTVIPCPGSTPVNVPGPSYAGPFGSPDPRAGFVCLQKGEGSLYKGFYGNLNWVDANVQIVGNVSGHGYMCDTKPSNASAVATYNGIESRAYVAICCGQAGCGDIPGTRDPRATVEYQPGQYVTRFFGGIDPFSGQPRTSASYRIYCRSDGTWERDIDKDQNACTRAGEIWTGSYCCSEEGDDSNPTRGHNKQEFYSDTNGSARGICFDSKFKPNGGSLGYTSAPQSIFIAGGQAYGCNGALLSYNSDGHIMPSGNLQVSEKKNSAEHFGVKDGDEISSTVDAAFGTADSTTIVAWQNNGDACVGPACKLLFSTEANTQPGVYAQLFNPDGTLKGANFKLGGSKPSTGIKAAYSPADNLFLVVWTDPSSLRASLVRPDGSIARQDFSLMSSKCSVGLRSEYYTEHNPGNPGLIFSESYGRIAYSPAAGKFVVTCTRDSDGSVAGMMVSADGSVSGTFSMGAGTMSSVAVGESNLLVTWARGTDKFARLVNPDGSFGGDALTVENKLGEIIAFFNPARHEYDIFYDSRNQPYLFNSSTLKKKTLPSGGGQLSAETVISNTTLFRDRTGDTIYPTIRGMAYSAEKNSYFLLTGSHNVFNGVSLYQIKPDGSVSYSSDVLQIKYFQHDGPLLVKDSSLISVNGVPMSVFNRAGDVVAQFAALTPAYAPDWPNPGGQSTNLSALKSLVKVYDTCTQVSSSVGIKFCDVDGVWKSPSGQNKSHFSTVPLDLLNYMQSQKPNTTMSPMSCCQENQCWDPLKNKCINEQFGANEYYYLNDTNKTYKCIGGSWGSPDARRFTPDGCQAGFCPEAGQCLYNPSGSSSQNGNVSGNPQCVFSGQFISDNYCLNGSWSSRTRLAAITLTRLLGSANDNFVLTCGSPNQILFRSQNPGLVNSVCVIDLKPGSSQNRRIFATSLNQELELPTINGTPANDFIFALKQSFWGAYPGSTFESACLNASGFDFSCLNGADPSNNNIKLLKLYYDNTTKVVVFSDREVTGLKPTLLEYVCDWFPPWLQWMCPTPPPISQSLTNLTFDRLYSGRLSSKETIGVQKDRCVCENCAKDSTFSFNYKGYSASDLLTLLGSPEVYAADDFSVYEPSNNLVNVYIKNPHGVDKPVLWDALSFLKPAN